jgi:hypothetical protein
VEGTGRVLESTRLLFQGAGDEEKASGMSPGFPARTTEGQKWWSQVPGEVTTCVLGLCFNTR